MFQDWLPELAPQIVGAARSIERAGPLRVRWASIMEELRQGARPGPNEAEPGEWPHGWQYFASSASEHHFRETVVLAQSCTADKAHLRSHSGAGCADVLCGCPSGPEFALQPVLFRAVVLERLRLPLLNTEARCECGASLDQCRRHRAACPRSGRLRTRAVPTERTLARVCREAGASVRCNAKLREMNIAVSVSDERSIEVLASGVPAHHGAIGGHHFEVRSDNPRGGAADCSLCQRSCARSSPA